MQVSLSSNGHEKTKKTSKYKKLLISKKRIGILKKLPKQGEDSEFVILFPYFDLKSYVVDHTTVKIGISNIIKSQTLTIFTLFR